MPRKADFPTKWALDYFNTLLTVCTTYCHEYRIPYNQDIESQNARIVPQGVENKSPSMLSQSSLKSNLPRK
jgi:hypothetical protein